MFDLSQTLCLTFAVASFFCPFRDGPPARASVQPQHDTIDAGMKRSGGRCSERKGFG